MPQFKVTIMAHDTYEKIVEAASDAEARWLVEAEPDWGNPDAGWKRGDDCSSGIRLVEELD